MIYDKASFTNEEYLELSINKFLIRSKLNELGFPVSDDQVESQVKSNEKRLNVNREQLMGFLKTQGISYDEYFEALREAMEYSYFINKVIHPLITVSEQEIKNEFIKKNSKDARLNIKYTLIDYSLPRDFKSPLNKNEFSNSVITYRQKNIIPENFSDLVVTNLDDLTEEGLNPDLKSLLKNTNEGALTELIYYNNAYHVFFIQKKDLVETEKYAAEKERIHNEIFEKISRVELALWLQRDRNKHFIKISL